MTVIVGVQHETGVYIGGDSATISGWTLELTGRPKVFRVGEFLFGVSGSPRVSGLICHAFAPPPVPKKAKHLDRYMVTKFIPTLRAVLGEAAAEKKQHDVAGIDGNSNVLVGVRGRLFEIHSDYQVTYNQPGYGAIGCGGDIALGALHVATGEDLPPRDRVIYALGAAEAHNMGVCGPFIIEHLPHTPQAPAPASSSSRAR